MDQQLNKGIEDGLTAFTAKYELDSDIISDLRQMLKDSLKANVKDVAPVPKASSGVKSSEKRQRRKTGYNLYINAKFSEAKSDESVPATDDSKTNSQELMSKFSKVWKALSDEDKKPYLDQAEELNGASADETPVAPKATKVAKEPSSKPEKGAKKALSGYNLFYSENKDTIKASLSDGQTLMKEVGAKWTALSDSEKEDYKSRAAEQCA